MRTQMRMKTSGALIAGVCLAMLFTGQTTLRGDDKDLKEHGPIHWTDSLEKAKKLALKEHKPIFVDFWANWCAPCKQMLKTTYKDKVVVEKSKQFITVLIDADKDTKTVKTYKVDLLPTIICLNSKGKLISQTSSLKSADEVLAIMSDALKKNK